MHLETHIIVIGVDNMGWLPTEYQDAFWFAVAPLTTIPTAVYTLAAMTSGDWRYGKPDWRANVRNTAIWSGIGGSVYAWNLLFSPHNAQYLSGTSAMKNALHFVRPPPAAFIGPVLVTGALYGQYKLTEAAVTNVAHGRPAWLGILPLPVANLFGFME